MSTTNAPISRWDSAGFASAGTPPPAVAPDDVIAWDAALAAAEAGVRLRRPENDTRSAQEIIDSSPLLRNLGNQSDVRDMLKEQVGDFETDPDAAYRAVQVLEHIERFDADGNRIAASDVGNGRVDGFTKDGDAKHGTEAGRLQDFGKHGFASLNGRLEHPSEAGDDTQARAQAEELGIAWERPDGDTRSAREILDDNPLLKDLGNQSGVRDMLKEQVGDFETDADAAYRAVQVLQHVEQLDADGNRLAGTDTGNNRIDGFNRTGDPSVEDGADPDASGEARNGTEAGRLQDFGKHGFSSLKGRLATPESAADDQGAREQAEKLGLKWERPEGDNRSAEDIIADSPLLAGLGERERNQLKTRVGDYETDADAAYRAVEVLHHIERYDAEGAPIRGDSSIGNDTLDGFTRAENGDARHGTEAGRFKDFIEGGYGTLKRADAEGAADIGKLEDLARRMSDDIPDEDHKHFTDFMDELRSGAYYHIIQGADLPENKRDMIAHPENYSVEQRGAAILELSAMVDRIADGAENWSEYGVVHANNHFGTDGFQFHSDPAKVMEQINGAISRLNSPEVGEWMAKAETEALQGIIDSSPTLQQAARDKVTELRDTAAGLDAAIKDNGSVIGGMRDYYALVSSLNLAAGDEGKPFLEDMTINIRESKDFEKIAKEYDNSLGNEDTLRKLVDGGMTEDQAMAELNSRAALFAAFGSPADEIASSVNRNITHYLMSTTTQEDLNGVILKPDGSLDEEKLVGVLEEIRRSDPESTFLKDDSGQPLTNGQIVTAVRNAWDSMRGTLKWNHTLLKPDVGGQPFLDRNNPLAQAYGAGTMHLVSSLLAGGAMVARAADGVTEKEIPAVIGGAMQMIGGFGEGSMLFTRSSDQRLNTLRSNWNALRPDNPLPDSNNVLKDRIGGVMDKLRVISATGGVFVMGASFAMGVEEARNGNAGAAAVYFAGGASQAATAPFAYTQALARSIGPWAFQNIGGMSAAEATAAANRVYNGAALWAGRVMSVANPVAMLAAIGYSIYAGVKQDQNTEAYFESFTPTLNAYGLDGGGANDPWYDEVAAPDNSGA
jgi:hypothetical protein